jgi:hypothetical protein
MVMPIGQYGPPNDMFPSSPWTEDGFNQYCWNKWQVVPDYGWAVREFGGDDISYGKFNPPSLMKLSMCSHDRRI